MATCMYHLIYTIFFCRNVLHTHEKEKGDVRLGLPLALQI